jgi:hypothetical protein
MRNAYIVMASLSRQSTITSFAYGPKRRRLILVIPDGSGAIRTWKKPAPDLIRGGYRFFGKDHVQTLS